RRPEGGTDAHGGRRDRPLPGAARALQVSQGRRLRAAAEDVDREGAEVRAPRAGVGGAAEAHSLTEDGMGSIGLIAAVAFVVGPLFAWLRILPPFGGFLIFALGGLLALVAGVMAIVRLARGRGLAPGGAAAVAAGIAFIMLAIRSAGSPRINDFTTDLAEPPT